MQNRSSLKGNQNQNKGRALLRSLFLLSEKSKKDFFPTARLGGLPVSDPSILPQKCRKEITISLRL